MRNLFLVLLLIPISLSANSGTWQPLLSQQPQNLATQLYCQGNILTLEIKIPGFYKQWRPEFQAYRLTVPGTGNVITPGSPCLPFISYLLALPEAAALLATKIDYLISIRSNVLYDLCR